MGGRGKIVAAIAAAVGIGLVIIAGLVASGLFLCQRVGERVGEAAAERRTPLAAQAERIASALDAAPDESKPPAARCRKAMDRGAAYLISSQGQDGSWGEGNVGITALCAQALLAAGKTVADPAVRRAVDLLLTAQKEDGGIYGDVGLKTYTTSIALMVLLKADPARQGVAVASPAAYADPIEKAKAYLVKNQWDEGESIDRANPWYGGHGYGQHERPDLSNTQYFVEAMHEAGIPKDHPLWKKVTVFVSRSQDLSESNDRAFVGTESGGMVYAPVGGGESKAGTLDLPDGRKGLKAYGSMTYAGFKSFIYADLARDDPRVQAAMDWIRRHWTFEENPDLGPQGLYYYYQTAAKALSAWGEDTVLDARRQPHDWRAELSEAILRRQRPDGSWLNEADRWYEGYPPVPTSYALIALAACQ